jgi:hypothetical protein
MAEKKTAANGPGATPARINKMQAMRDALQKLGSDASSADLYKELKRHGVEMSTKNIATYKSDILRKAAEQAEHSLRPAAGNGKSSAVAMHDILTLKELVNRVGPDHLHKLIDVMAR